jgi:hypothetical protein
MLGPMSIVAGTRLRLRSAWHLPAFLWGSIRSMRQARSAPGFVRGRVLLDRDLAAWTLTVWASEATMRDYRNRDPHRAAMAKSGQLCDELVTAHWAQEGDELPGWDVVVARLLAEGRFLKLPSPSPRQVNREVPAPAGRWPLDFTAKS